MTGSQRTLYSVAREQIEHNLAVLRPGMTSAEFNEKSWRIPVRYQPCRYSVALHGVGMVDEWPSVPTHVDFTARPIASRFEPGMVLCVESLIGEQGGPECIKLETQALITETGAQRLDSFPCEDSL
jgi:Xaa-Pro aminopeptidase